MHPILTQTLSTSAAKAPIAEQTAPKDLLRQAEVQNEVETSFTAAFDEMALTPLQSEAAKSKITDPVPLAATSLPDDPVDEIDTSVKKSDTPKVELENPTRPTNTVLQEEVPLTGRVSQTHLEKSLVQQVLLGAKEPQAQHNPLELPRALPPTRQNLTDPLPKTQTQTDAPELSLKSVPSAVPEAASKRVDIDLPPLPALSKRATMEAQPAERPSFEIQKVSPLPDEKATPSNRQTTTSDARAIPAESPTTAKATPVPLGATSQIPVPTPEVPKRTNVRADTVETMTTQPASAKEPAPQSQPVFNVTKAVRPQIQSDVQKTVSFLDLDPFAVPRADATTSTSTTPTHILPTRAELPQHVSRQIADALQHMPNRPVEITLSPKELGSVRLGVSTSESNILVSVVAERPETTELLRRYISTLETAFQELGYSNISFAFTSGDGTQADTGEEAFQQDKKSQQTTEDIAPEIAQIHLSAAPVTGLDIRL